MSALPIMRIAPQDDPLWIPASTAAGRAGYSSGHMRRLCKQLAARGMAVQEKLDNGQKGWIVREDADPKFAPQKPAQSVDQAFSIADLPEAAQKVVMARKRILDLIQSKAAQWQQEGKQFKVELRAYLQWLFDNEGVHGRSPKAPIATSTYYNWVKDLKEQGLRGLLDDRMEANVSDPMDDPFFAEVLRLWLTQQKRKVQKCYDNALDTAHERGWAVPSYRQVQRAIAAWAAENPTEVTRLRMGREAYVNECEPYIECDYSTLRSNEIWNSDHYQFDVWVLVGYETRIDRQSGEVVKKPRFARPWLTSWQDLRSRKIVGHVISLAPNQDTIQLAFYRAITSHGVPETVLTDNGKDYDAWSLQGMTKAQRRKLRVEIDAAAIQGLFGSIGVKSVHCEPYHPQSKAIERFHRTLKDRFCTDFETYCGGKPDDRPEDCFTKMSQGQAPTLESFVKAFGEWVENDYHWKIHTGQAMGDRPAIVWEKCLASKTLPDPRAAELLKQRIVNRPVGQNGITWMDQTYAAPELLRRVGHDLVIRVDHENTNQISVWEPTGEFICFASPKQLVPRNAARTEFLTQAIREKRSDARVQRQMAVVRQRSGKSIAQRAAAAASRAADQAKGEAPSLPPAPLRIARTVLDDQLDEYERRREMRSAVGDGVVRGRTLEELENVYQRD